MKWISTVYFHSTWNHHSNHFHLWLEESQTRGWFTPRHTFIFGQRLIYTEWSLVDTFLSNPHSIFHANDSKIDKLNWISNNNHLQCWLKMITKGNRCGNIQFIHFISMILVWKCICVVYHNVNIRNIAIELFHSQQQWLRVSLIVQNHPCKLIV